MPSLFYTFIASTHKYRLSMLHNNKTHEERRAYWVVRYGLFYDVNIIVCQLTSANWDVSVIRAADQGCWFILCNVVCVNCLYHINTEQSWMLSCSVGRYKIINNNWTLDCWQWFFFLLMKKSSENYSFLYHRFCFIYW